MRVPPEVRGKEPLGRWASVLLRWPKLLLWLREQLARPGGTGPCTLLPELLPEPSKAGAVGQGQGGAIRGELGDCSTDWAWPPLPQCLRTRLALQMHRVCAPDRPWSRGSHQEGGDAGRLLGFQPRLTRQEPVFQVELKPAHMPGTWKEAGQAAFLLLDVQVCTLERGAPQGGR